MQKSSRGVAVGDLDNDGDPDLVVSAMDEEPTLLENTQQSGHHWVGVDVRQQGPNPFAIGARVTLEDAGGRRQIREVRSGGGYLSQNDLRALFGLGDGKGPVTVEVRLGPKRWRFPAVCGRPLHDRCTWTTSTLPDRSRLLAACPRRRAARRHRFARRGRPGRASPGPGQPYRYRPKLAVSESLQPFLEEMKPGSDLFPDERVAGKLIARLSELSASLKEGPDRAARIPELLLAPSFRGGRLRPLEEEPVAASALQVFRARRMSSDPAAGRPRLRPRAARPAR